MNENVKKVIKRRKCKVKIRCDCIGDGSCLVGTKNKENAIYKHVGKQCSYSVESRHLKRCARCTRDKVLNSSSSSSSSSSHSSSSCCNMINNGY